MNAFNPEDSPQSDSGQEVELRALRLRISNLRKRVQELQSRADMADAIPLNDDEQAELDRSKIELVELKQRHEVLAIEVEGALVAREKWHQRLYDFWDGNRLSIGVISGLFLFTFSLAIFYEINVRWDFEEAMYRGAMESMFDDLTVSLHEDLPLDDVEEPTVILDKGRALRRQVDMGRAMRGLFAEMAEGIEIDDEEIDFLIESLPDDPGF
jgi:hypothetical protein